jgi:hypothetical protein
LTRGGIGTVCNLLKTLEETLQEALKFDSIKYKYGSAVIPEILSLTFQ